MAKKLSLGGFKSVVQTVDLERFRRKARKKKTRRRRYWVKCGA